MSTPAQHPAPCIALAGSTGTIGQAVHRELLRRGYAVHELGRAPFKLPSGCQTVISCMASRTGLPDDAWAVDYQAQRDLLACLQPGLSAKAGQAHFILLSAICVQRPALAFQEAKLAFERELVNSGLRYTIVRPTAFFKSLSGQVARVLSGKPFMVFGNGELTRCKPISDNDLAVYLVDCLNDSSRWSQTLVIGGPGPAISPLGQARLLEHILGRPVPVRHVPLWFMRGLVRLLDGLGLVVPGACKKAMLARIGLYYATESMLVWNPTEQRYSDQQTPEFGQDRLEDHYKDLISGGAQAELGSHAVFKN